MARLNIHERNIKNIQTHGGVFEWLFEHIKQKFGICSFDLYLFSYLPTKIKRVIGFFFSRVSKKLSILKATKYHF